MRWADYSKFIQDIKHFASTNSRCNSIWNKKSKIC